MCSNVHCAWRTGSQVLGVATQQDAGAAAVGSGLAGGSQLPLAEVTPSLLEWRPLQGHVR